MGPEEYFDNFSSTALHRQDLAYRFAQCLIYRPEAEPRKKTLKLVLSSRGKNESTV